MDNFKSGGNHHLKFSLIVATKHRVTEVEAFLESLAIQKYKNFETIIVDQNEDDRLAMLIARYRKDLEILHIKTETGLSKARNAGLKLVSGDIVAFPDDDCLYPDDLLNLLNHLFATHYNCDGIAGSLTESINLPFTKSVVNVNKRNVWKTVKSATVFLRKRVTLKTGLFDENLGIGSPNGLGAGEETDYLLRALSHGFSVVQITEARIIHPPIIKDFNQWRKVFSYTKGASYVLRKYDFPTYTFLYQILKPITGIVVFGLIFQSNRVKYYYYSLKGKLSGYFYPRESIKNRSYKIAFSTSSEIGSARSGLSVYMNELLKKIIEQDQHNVYHLFIPKNHVKLFEEIISAARANVVIHFTSPFFNKAVPNIFWHFFIYPYYLWKYKIDLVHLPEYRRTILFSRCKKVMTVHDLIGLNTNRFDGFRSFYNKKLVFPLLNKIDHFIAVSENTRSDLIKSVDIDNVKITTIYEGTGERFRRRNNDEIPLAIRNKYNFPFLLYVGRIEHPNKNHVNLIRAFQILKRDKQFSRHKLVLAGKLATGSNYVIEEIKRTGLEQDIVVTGYLEDQEIPFLYNLALLKVYPSVYEGFGLPVLEGYTSGVPVVCSKSSSLLELSCSSEMLFDCYSPEDICEKMKNFLVNDDLKNKQLKLQSVFLEKFSWVKTAEQTIAIYNWVNSKN